MRRFRIFTCLFLLGLGSCLAFAQDSQPPQVSPEEKAQIEKQLALVVALQHGFEPQMYSMSFHLQERLATPVRLAFCQKWLTPYFRDMDIQEGSLLVGRAISDKPFHKSTERWTSFLDEALFFPIASRRILSFVRVSDGDTLREGLPSGRSLPTTFVRALEKTYVFTYEFLPLIPGTTKVGPLKGSVTGYWDEDEKAFSLQKYHLEDKGILQWPQ